MITQADLSFYLGCLQFLSKYCLTPFDIRLPQSNSSDLVAIPAGKRKRYIWNCLYAYGIARTCHSCIAFATTLATKAEMSGYELGSGFLYCVIDLAMVILTWFAAVRTPEITSLVFRLGLPAEVTSTGRNSNVKKRNRVPSILSRWRLRGFSCKELFIIYLPHCVGIAFLGVQLMVATFSSGLHVYQCLPDSYKNPVFFSMLFAHEYVLWVISATHCVATVENMLLFFEKVNEDLIREIQVQRDQSRQCASNMQRLLRCTKFCRETQLGVKFFNIGQPPIVYCLKLVILAVAVLSGYLGVRHFSDSSIISMFLISLSLYVTFVYNVTFSRAFSIPGYMKDLKKE